MAWQLGDALPYDGFYNGNVKLMIDNGTYEDFRPKILMQVEDGFYGKNGGKMLDKWDEEWSKIPLEERMATRAVVVDDSTPKEKEFVTAKGIVKVLRAKPSENNNSRTMNSKKRIPADKNPKLKRAKGALTNENNPLISKTSVK